MPRQKALPFAQFASDDSGAVTVDWVVLTAAITGLVFILVATLNESLVQNTAQDGIAAQLYNSQTALQSALDNGQN